MDKKKDTHWLFSNYLSTNVTGTGTDVIGIFRGRLFFIKHLKLIFFYFTIIINDFLYLRIVSLSNELSHYLFSSAAQHFW